MGIGPRQPEHVGEEPLGEAMPAHDQLRQCLARRREADRPVGGDQAFGLEPADHLADTPDD